jgi:hypothetical protein
MKYVHKIRLIAITGFLFPKDSLGFVAVSLLSAISVVDPKHGYLKTHPAELPKAHPSELKNQTPDAQA